MAQPLRRERLTKENLKTFTEGIGGRKTILKGVSKGAWKGASKAASKGVFKGAWKAAFKDALKGKPETKSFFTPGNRDFGTPLEDNNIIVNDIEELPPTDINEIRELLQRPPKSELPNARTFQRYKAKTLGIRNEMTMQRAYSMLTEEVAERQILGYTEGLNYIWSNVESPLSEGFSYTTPDVIESYLKSQYPKEARTALAGFLSPTTHDIAMPAYAVEFNGSDGSQVFAQLQCAYDGALMTEAAYAVHRHVGQPDQSFFGKTQALTVAFTGLTIDMYAHYAIQLPTPQGGLMIQYRRFCLYSGIPRTSLQCLQDACHYVRNAQAIAFDWAMDRRHALWVFYSADNRDKGDDDEEEDEDNGSIDVLS
jgi:hypothetical protein